MSSQHPGEVPVGDVPPAPDVRPEWQRVVGMPWRGFRRLPAWAQVVGWLLGFWILPALWLFARAKGPPGLVGGAAAAVLGLVVLTSAGGAEPTGPPTATTPGTATVAEPTPGPTDGMSTPPSSPSPSRSPTPVPSTEPDVTSTPTSTPAPAPSPAPTTAAPADETAASGLPADGRVTTVERIVDGDTLYLAGFEVRARLIGIDTPETVAPGRPVECFGPEATAHLTDLVPPGTEVVVTRDVELVDRYDRPLVYLHRASDGVFVNEAMLADGFAQLATYPPNVAHVETFRAAQRAARNAGAGLWGDTCDDEARGSTDGSTGSTADAATGDGTAGAPSSAGGGVVIAEIVWDGPGNDVEYGTSEHVVLRNESGAAVDVGGWSLTDEVDHRIVIPGGYRIPPGGELRVHTGPGEQADDAWHEGRSQAIWNNSGGDTATLRDAGGSVVDEFSYSS